MEKLPLKEFLVTRGLTFREAEVALCIYEGLRSSQAGEKLFIDEKTIKFHLTSIYKKLGFTKAQRHQLLRLCMSYGLTEELTQELECEKQRYAALEKENQILRNKLISNFLPKGNP